MKTGIGAFSANRGLIPWLAVMACAGMCGRYLILLSIGLKNPAVSSLIEITYPFFTVLFVWLLFGEMHLTWATGFGSLLIFAGVGLIYLKG